MWVYTFFDRVNSKRFQKTTSVVFDALRVNVFIDEFAYIIKRASTRENLSSRGLQTTKAQTSLRIRAV